MINLHGLLAFLIFAGMIGVSILIIFAGLIVRFAAKNKIWWKKLWISSLLFFGTGLLGDTLLAVIDKSNFGRIMDDFGGWIGLLFAIILTILVFVKKTA